MPAGRDLERVSVEEYLARERKADVRHEYIGGLVYAMAGSSEEHNLITLNLATALHSYLRGKSCRAFTAELKLRLELANTDIFYYPDIFVSCDPADSDRYFKTRPKVVIEVLSESTEAVDRREKFMSYTQIPFLEEYVLVAQDRVEVTIFRRASNWQPEVLASTEEVFKLWSLGFEVPVSRVYERIKLK
jgi:Uma2 family endonuclease